MQKKIANLEFVQWVNFEFLESVKNNDTKYLLTSDDLFEESCNSKMFIICATTEKHLGLNTIYTKHKLLHQSKVARDVEPENTHIVVFKSPYDVMQISTLSAQLGLGSKLVDWYRDATSVNYRHLLIKLSPRSDDRLSHCTNGRSIP